MSKVMQAAVMTVAGPPSVLTVTSSHPVPIPEHGKQVLIKIHGAGLNRSELFTRQGHSPGLQYPRVLGVEATGTIAAAPGNEHQFPLGTPCATAMGGLGRVFDGGYAEYCVANAENVQLLPSAAVATLGWAKTAAAPEMLQTAYGSLKIGLRIQPDDVLLIRGGTTSVGLAAAALAKTPFHVKTVVGTTRRGDAETATMMRAAGFDDVLVDTGELAPTFRAKYPSGAEKTLELVGTITLLDSLQCTWNDAQSGSIGEIVCLTGIVGNSWTMDAFQPMDGIGTGRYLTSYSGGPREFMSTPLGEMLELAASGKLNIQLGKTFRLDKVVKAHEVMERNEAGGKAVLLTRFAD